MSAASSRQIADQATAAPACPRCAYDLSGEVTRWADQCPTTGICPECGLDVDWRDVLVRKYNYPEWFFETASVRRGRALRRTIFLSVLPWRFWAKVRMNHPIHAPRAFACCVIGIIGWTLALSGLRIPFCVFNLDIWIDDVIDPLLQRQLPSWNVWLRFLGLSNITSSAWSMVALSILPLMPFAALLLPATLRRLQVRREHLLRIAAYSLITPALIFQAGLLALPFFAIFAWAANELGWASFPGSSAVPYGTPARLLRGQEILSGCTAAFLLVWPFVWWWAACRFYLKLPRPFVVAFTLGGICLLVVTTIAFILFQGIAYQRLFEFTAE